MVVATDARRNNAGAALRGLSHGPMRPSRPAGGVLGLGVACLAALIRGARPDGRMPAGHS
jgi:hypothetical protein